MKIGEQIRFIVINMKASSLYSLIADENTETPRWVVTRGRHSLAQRPRCSLTVTRKDLMLCVASLITPKRESASLLTTRIIATPATPGLALVQEGNLMTITRVETRLLVHRIMEINTLKPCVTF